MPSPQSAPLYLAPSPSNDLSAAAKPSGAPTPKLRNLRAHFDTVDAGRVHGWAWDPDQPSTRLKVEVWADGSLAAIGDADRLREDLLKAGIGDGCVHFVIPLPPRLYDGQAHAISVRVAGAAQPFGEPITVVLTSQALRVWVEAIEGATMRAIVESLAEDWRSIDLYVDNQKRASIAAAPQRREAVALELPSNVLDGAVHWFEFRSSDGAELVGQHVAATTFVATPEFSLQRFARGFPGILSANASRRYDALAKQIEFAPQFVAKQAPGPGGLSLESYLDQVARAHAQVMLGPHDRPGVPKTLAVLEYPTPRVSIVVPAHNKFSVTYNCIAALILAPNQATSEIILVDDGSSDQTSEIENFISGVTIVRHEKSQGFVRASNSGAEIARGEFVVMLNNDTEPCAGWLDELIYVFEHFSDVGLVGAKFVYPNGKLQEAGGLVFHTLEVWNYGRDQNPRDPRFNYIRQIDYCSGAGIMLRSDHWRELKGFDEHFAPAYYEDTDLAFRVRAKGLKTYYTPFSEIVHFEGMTSGASIDSGAKRYQAVNEPKFRARWASTIRKFPQVAQADLAKDRGAQLRALVIDAEAPQPDRDAGSYAAIQEMRLLQTLGVKLSFVPENLAYLGNYTEALQRMGVEALYAPFQNSIEGLIEERGAEFDFFYITRYSVATRYIDLIRRRAPQARIVFCNADLHFLREVRSAIATRDPAMMQKAVETRALELDVMRRADVTLSYTETEAAVIASHNLDGTKVMRCPWVIEPSASTPPFEGRSGLAFLGNYRHPPNEEAVLYFVNQIMPPLRQLLPGVKFHIYGSHLPERMQALAAEDIVIEGFAESLAEVHDRARVFVAALLSGAGIKGKVLGALAAGVPTVVSPLAAEGIGLSAGVEAMVAESPQDWVRAIVALYKNERRWTEMSQRARAFVATNFSFEQGLRRMRDALAVAGVYTE